MDFSLSLCARFVISIEFSKFVWDWRTSLRLDWRVMESSLHVCSLAVVDLSCWIVVVCCVWRSWRSVWRFWVVERFCWRDWILWAFSV